ncbi:serine/threonine-protein phosphatase PP2A catalytic subunit [Cordyceps fumosorosea ARSEF 2679]|uniref:Serine/threonine-protein phosphatase n=1 Tax=Cordyceps fumosorosea (strain ARSEF 2679) TaxID=1081104 RepID=A0A168B2D4_CORFA|nr:serine/threonine-protein phosphatase PP2A catalytic subunit [Cordyceps fumosorosea ARSEF 2679]OAA69523.1 serine/threonine-protein phosphatase PP2A catalytic subunit [Cordyceps fumosorosea ARSEF 2679]
MISQPAPESLHIQAPTNTLSAYRSRVQGQLPRHNFRKCPSSHHLCLEPISPRPTSTKLPPPSPHDCLNACDDNSQLNRVSDGPIFVDTAAGRGRRDGDAPITMPGLPTSVDLDECISRLYKKELLAESVIEAICAKTKELLMRESNVVHVQAPVTVVGDIHGQFYDLIEIFRIGGYCPDTNYLFLGDYVDRGMFSVETISLLVCLKLRYPERVHLIRGNHESRGVTQSYGFYTECARKYGNANVWHYFTDMFDFMTLSVVIDNQIFCVHGGLSPSIHSIDQIKIIDRFREIPHEGPMADLVWSDPDPERDEFSLSPRGAGYTFGAQVVKKFLAVNNMSHILRAHQLCQEGFQVLYDDRLSTVWSAPNYCYRCGNMASVLEVNVNGERFFNVFAAAPENDQVKDMQPGVDKAADGNALPDYFL